MSYTKPTIASVHFDDFKSTLPSMEGKTVAITGTTSGIGDVAARTVAGLGARVVVLNRPSPRAEASFAALKAAYPTADLHAIDCDLQAFDTVRSAVKQVQALCPDGLHVLCNNAGVMATPDAATEDGYDVQMQTNHLSHFLLTGELMPSLEQAAQSSGQARVVNHSSIARMAPSKTLMARFLERRGGDLGGNGSGLQNAFMRGPRWLRYNQSKLANCAFTAALHERLQARGSKVKALVAHPGLANTNLQVTSIKEGGMGKTMTGLFMRMSQSPEDGAMGILSAMCLEDAQSGQFYGPGAGMMAGKGKAIAFDLEPFYDNPETHHLIWEMSSEAVGTAFLA